MPIYPYSFQLPPLNVQDIPSNGAVGEFLGISAGGVLDWLPVATGGGDMLKSENLSGLADYAIARTNIGLGTASTPTFANLTLTSPSLASSAPVTISQTWGTTGTYTAFKVVATETLGANANSNLLELWAGSTPALDFAVTKAGAMQAYGTYSSSGANYARLALACDSSGNATISTQALGTGTAGVLAFSPGNSEKMRITAAGNVGIGTTAPDAKLSIEDASAATRASISNTSNSAFGAGFFFRTLSGGSVVSVGTIRTGNDGNLALFTGTTAGNESEKLRILASGNVGIGTTNPTATLDVVGSGLVSIAARSGTGTFDGAYFSAVGQREGFFNVFANGNASGSRIMRFGNSSDNTFVVQALNDAGLAVLRTPVSISNTAPTGSFNILSSGNVGIGTPSPTSKLHVAGSSPGLTVENNIATGYSEVLFKNTVSTGSSIFLNGSTQAGYGGASSLNIYSSSGPLAFHTASVTNALSIAQSGTISTAGAITVGSGGYYFGNDLIIGAVGVAFTIGSTSYRLQMNGIRLTFNGVTNAFPAIERDGAGVKFVDATGGSTSWIKVPPVAVSALPLAATAGAGARAFVNDASSPTFGSAVTGGGAVLVPVYSTGSAWHVG